MKILGIVGEICAGKTTVAKEMLGNKELNDMFVGGIVYLEGDAEIKKMYSLNIDIINQIRSVYPDCIKNNIVDTKILGEFFFKTPENQKIIENIVHPALKKEISDFIEQNYAKNVLLILDVPVLFKLGLNEICNYIVFFTANHGERIDRGINRIVAKYKMDKIEAKKRFLNIDDIAIKKIDLHNEVILIDNTNYEKNQNITILETIKKIIYIIKNIA